MNNTASIVSIFKGFNLETGLHTQTIVLALPTGDRIAAEVDAAAYRTLERALLQRKEEAESPPAPEEAFEHSVETAASTEDPIPQEQYSAARKQKVNWYLLPDDILPSLVKAAMRALEVNSILTLEEVYSVRSQLEESLNEEDWEKLRRAQVVPTPPSPPAGQPTWTDGTPIVPAQRRPGRRVQADEAGNPIVPGMVEADPGELVSSGAERDEDGVASW